MIKIPDQALCNLTSISDYILSYTFEGLIIIWGVLMLVMLIGLIWLGQKIWVEILEELGGERR